MRKKSFTLVELLVVVAIIAVLVAILLPALQSARDAAQAVVCMSNLKQQAMAVQFYLDDNNNYFPPSLAHGSGSPYHPGWLGWMERINVYLKNPEVFRCPAEHEVPFYYFSSPIIDRGCYHIHYGWNFVFLTFGNNYMSSFDTSRYKDFITTNYRFVKDPERTIMIVDGRTYDSNPSSIAFLPSDRHRGKSNILWIDGHVSAMETEKIISIWPHTDHWFWWNNWKW